MTYANEQVQDLFNAAADDDYTFIVRSDGELDYRGKVASEALDAVLAVDEAEVRFIGLGLRTGWALILPGLEEGEQIADASGWVDDWMANGGGR